MSSFSANTPVVESIPFSRVEPLRDGPHAFADALETLNFGGRLEGRQRAALSRAFGRHPLLRALVAIDAGHALLRQVEPGLYICAPNEKSLSRLDKIFSDAWAHASNAFVDPPTILVQFPSIFGPRLAATPATGIAFIQFPLFPAEGMEESFRAARHEICHAFCWSGRRFLDEGLADYFSDSVSRMDAGDRLGPSTRALIEPGNGTDLHFEQQAGDSIAALRLRRRGAQLAQELVEKHGWAKVRELCGEILCLSGSEAADRIELALQLPLADWDKLQRNSCDDSLSCAKERIANLSAKTNLESGDLVELDALLRDARREGGHPAEITELLAQRASLGLRASQSNVLKIRHDAALITLKASRAMRDKTPLRRGGISLSIGKIAVEGDRDFELQLEGFDLRAGERVGLVGANGSGKSTLLSMMVSSRRNVTTFDGIASEIWLKSPGNRRKLGLALGEFPYHPVARVGELIDLHARMYGVPDAEIAEAFDISRYAHTQIDKLSRGWRQILCLYFAFAHNPQLVLLDEPSVGLDDEHAVALRRLLDPRTNTRAQTIVIASHVAADLEALDRLVVLSKGRVAANSEASDMLEAYGPFKAFVIDPCASDFADELRSLPGVRGTKRIGGRLCLSGDQTFVTAFTALARRLNLKHFGIEPTTLDDLIAYMRED